MYGTGYPFGGSDPVFDSAGVMPAVKKPQSNEYTIPDQILDDASNDLGEKQIRANAMAAALTWLEDNDASYSNFEAIVAGLADLDEDGEVTEPEEELFNEILTMAADSLVELGANAANVESFIDSESEEAGEKLHTYLNDKLSENEKSDDELITEYAVKAKLVLDATQRGCLLSNRSYQRLLCQCCSSGVLRVDLLNFVVWHLGGRNPKARPPQDRRQRGLLPLILHALGWFCSGRL
mgnify:CR=1 FL=1